MVKGRIVNLNGGTYKVLLDTNEVVSVKARGKLRATKVYQVNEKSYSKKKVMTEISMSPKVGDIAYIENEMIDHVEPRKNEMIRPDVANVDQILLVFAAIEPDFSFYLLDLFIVNILKQNIKPLIVVSKIDKLSEEALADLKFKLGYYEKLGYDVLFVNSKSGEGTDKVLEHLKDNITILSGQTGAGKSTLINALIPGFNLQTQEISMALGRGKHTTRETSLYEINGGFIGDTPGFSKLDVLGVSLDELEGLFVEFKEHPCRFKDCKHVVGAKDCGVKLACDEGLILSSRHENYLKMYSQIKERK